MKKQDEHKNKAADQKQINITLLGDSTIDNRIWVDGLIKSRVYTILGIQRDSALVRVQKSHRIIGKPALSVVENVMDMMPNHIIHDYTNDGFTTYDVLYGALRDKVFGTGTFSLFPDTYFEPLHAGKESIKKSRHIIVSVGGNDFREFLMRASRYKKEGRKYFIRQNLRDVLEVTCDRYVKIIQKIRQLNPDAQIILMTQYYPSASQNNYKIYPFMKEIGDALQLVMSHNPMTVIHYIMKMTYTDILKRVPQDNIVVADITSSLNPFDNKNHVSQIEPSGLGGKKIAQMLKYIMTSDKVVSGQVYRFFPQFFTTNDQDNHVEGSNFSDWVPAHPWDLKNGYTLAEEKVFRKYNDDQFCIIDRLLQRLNQAMQQHDNSSPLYNAALAVHQEAKKLLSHIMLEEDIKKLKMSVVLAINVLETPKTHGTEQNPEYLNAVRLLKDHAECRAIGKANNWNRFYGALSILAGVAMIGLGIALVPFTGGASLVGLCIAGSFLGAGGGILFYHNRQKSLAKKSDILANEANRVKNRI